MRNYINKLIASICILHRMVNSLSSYPQVGAYLFKIKNTPLRGVKKTFNSLRLSALIVQIRKSRIGKQAEWTGNPRSITQAGRQDFDNGIEGNRYPLVGHYLSGGNCVEFNPVLWKSLIRWAGIEGWCLPPAIFGIEWARVTINGSCDEV